MYVVLTTALIFVCSFIGMLYLQWLKTKRYWTDRGIPHLPPVPILGSFTFLQKENIGHWLRRMNQQFKSPYIGIWVFWRPGLIVNSPEIVRNILVKDFDNFKNRFISSGEKDAIGGLNLFTVKDPTWSTMRRHLTVMFTAAKLRIFQDYTRTKSKELVQRIHNDRNIKINLKEMYIDYATDVIGTSVFGIKTDAMLTGVGPLREVSNDFSRYSWYRCIAWYSIFFFPELVDIFRFKFFPKSTTDYFKKIFRTMVSQRENNIKDKETDLLDILIRLQKENESLSEDLIIAQAAIFLQGGFDTSGHLLTYVTYELAHNPDVQDKLYKELSKAAQNNGIDNFDMTVLSELPYLNCVIKEGLRMYSPMGWIDRIAANDYKVDDKLTIEAGTVIYINGFGIHYDPNYYPDPYKFNPDRFLPESGHKVEPYTFLPFGEGPRACIGKRFGLMTVQFALASLSLNYNIRPYPNTPKPSDIEISALAVWTLPKIPLYVKFIPRS